MGRKRPQRRRERGVWWYTRNNQRKKLNGRGWKESEESRGSGLQAVPLIQRFSGPLMGLVREKTKGKGLGMLCPSGLLGWTEGSLPHPPLRPVPCQ